MRVDLDQPEPLVAAIGFLISEMMPVLVPAEPRRTKVDAIDRGLGLLAAADVKKVELVGGEFVAGQRVGAFLQAGPAPARRRRLDQEDFLRVAGLDAEGDQCLGIGGPRQAAVGEPLFAIGAQPNLLGFALRGGW